MNTAATFVHSGRQELAGNGRCIDQCHSIYMSVDDAALLLSSRENVMMAWRKTLSFTTNLSMQATCSNASIRRWERSFPKQSRRHKKEEQKRAL